MLYGIYVACWPMHAIVLITLCHRVQNLSQTKQQRVHDLITVYWSNVYCTVLFAATTCMRGGNIYTLVQDTNCRSFTQSTAELPPQVHTCPPNLTFNMTLCNVFSQRLSTAINVTDLLSHSFFLRNSLGPKIPHSERYFFEINMCASMYFDNNVDFANFNFKLSDYYMYQACNVLSHLNKF